MGAGQRIREHRDEILRLASIHGAGNVLLFGSVARGEDTPESDVDFLVSGLSMAGFEVTLYGRFWVTPEVQSP